VNGDSSVYAKHPLERFELNDVTILTADDFGAAAYIGT
jgi:hypothetical protein